MNSGASGTDLPEQNTFHGQQSKTPGHLASKSIKKYGHLGNFSNNTAPSKHISP
jgi:hypothetical protein